VCYIERAVATNGCARFGVQWLIAIFETKFLGKSGEWCECIESAHDVCGISSGVQENEDIE
jgi:hypothetical protein